MENTNTAEVINSQTVISNIFKDFNTTAEPPVTNQEPVNEVQTQVENTEIIPTTEEVKQTITTDVVTDYSRRLKTAISDGLIENFQINYNDQEAFLEDITDLTEEGYNEIISAYKAEKDKTLKEKYISTEDLDDQTKKLIEIRKAGGNISEIVKENITAIEQLTQLRENIDNVNVQANIVGKDLEQKGAELEVIQAQIQRLIERGELEDKANLILDSHLSIHNEAIEQKRQSELQRVEQENQDFKNLRKNLSTIYQEMNVPENIKKVLIDNATKADSDKITNMDKLYFETIKDPKRLAELNYFLNNPEEFKKQVSSKKVLESQVNTTKTLFTINTNNQKKTKMSPNTVEEYVGQLIKNHNTN